MLGKSRFAALLFDKCLAAITAVTDVLLFIAGHVFVLEMLVEFVDLAPSLLAVLGAFALSFVAGALYFTIAVVSGSRSLCRTIGATGLSRSCGDG